MSAIWLATTSRFLTLFCTSCWAAILVFSGISASCLIRCSLCLALGMEYCAIHSLATRSASGPSWYQVCSVLSTRSSSSSLLMSSMILRLLMTSSPSLPSSSRNLFLLSAGPSPNRHIGSPSFRRSSFTSESLVDTLIDLTFRLLSNSSNMATLSSDMISLSMAMYWFDTWMLSFSPVSMLSPSMAPKCTTFCLLTYWSSSSDMIALWPLFGLL